jgi:hypothetical protein
MDVHVINVAVIVCNVLFQQTKQLIKIKIRIYDPTSIVQRI